MGLERFSSFSFLCTARVACWSAMECFPTRVTTRRCFERHVMSSVAIVYCSCSPSRFFGRLSFCFLFSSICIRARYTHPRVSFPRLIILFGGCSWALRLGRSLGANDKEKKAPQDMRGFVVRGDVSRYAFSTRSVYSPVSVLMRMMSPSLMNIGTFAVAPVSSVTILVAFPEVLPRTAGADSVTLSSTLIG